MEDVKSAVCPSSPKYISYRVEFPIDDEVVFHLVDLIFPGWDQENVKYKEFYDGISNRLFGIYCGEDINTSPCFLVRVHCSKQELVDRNREIATMRVLHHFNMAPTIFARLENALCYNYVPGCTLDEDTIRSPKIAKLIAMEMAKLHSIPMDYLKNHLPFNGNGLFRTLKQWIDLLPESNPTVDRDTLRRETDCLETVITKFDTPISLAHQDTLIKNFVVNPDKSRVHMIDMEYADYGYSLFDIGNHFAEYGGIDEIDYARYPDRDFQMKWIRYYLQCMQSVQRPGTLPEQFDINSDEVDNCYRQVNFFALVSHLFWTVWAMVQLQRSTIAFNYAKFAEVRYTEYWRRKGEFLNLLQRIPSVNCPVNNY